LEGLRTCYELLPEGRYRSLAVFDDDLALWSEPPMHMRLAFALDRVTPLATARGGPGGRTAPETAGQVCCAIWIADPRCAWV
jgi:hypothetical protein